MSTADPNAPYLDGLLQLTVRSAGNTVGTSAAVNLSSAFTATTNSTTKAIDVDVNPAALASGVVAAIAGQAIAPGSIALPAGATFTLGPFTGAAGSFITTDGTSGHAVARAPLAVNMGATFLVIAEGICTTSSGGDVGRIYTYQSEPAASITTGGSPSISNSPSTTSTFTGSPTSPSLDLVYGGGFLTLGATGVAGDTIKWSAAILLVASG